MRIHIKETLAMGMFALLLTACSDHDEGSSPLTEPAAISFATSINNPSTRATTGLIKDLNALKAVPEGFGVFGYLTDAANFATTFPNAASYTSFSNFFMQNQQVTWAVQYVDGEGNGVKDWVYSPLKYWPNYTDNNNSDPGPRYISFFAYAPYAAEAGATWGITNFTRDGDRTPHVIYQLGAPNQQVDLLWAKCQDATRNGEGLITADASPLTYQKVPLDFHHALAAVDIYIQRVYDEPAYTGKTPDTDHTKLYVSKLRLTSPAPASGKNALQKSGKLNLTDGSWEDDGTWVGTEDVSIDYLERVFVDSLRGTLSNDEEVIRDAELDKWGTTTSGITQKELYLLKDSLTQMFLPRKVTLIPTLTYSMVTRDDNLEINYLTDTENHRYARIINEVTGNSLTLDLVAGKRYTLLLRVSAEHVSFEVLSVVDWDFPMRYTPAVVTDYENENIGHIVNEQ